MSEGTKGLLVKVESALHAGDQRSAGILLHKILLQDFTNQKAWLLLQQLRGNKLPLEDFQQSFAQRYYPNLAHLLDQIPEPEPAPQPAEAQPAETATDRPASSLFCTFCGAALLPKAKFCSFCGKSLSHESEWQPIEFDTLGAKSDAPSEAEKKQITSELQHLESLINKPEPPPTEARPVTAELDRVLKRSTSPPRGTGSLDPKRLPPRRRPYCPTCRKLFEPDDLFCDVCWAPLFQMVDKIPEEPAVAPQPPANTSFSFVSPPAPSPISESEELAPSHLEPEPDVPAIAPSEPEFDHIEDLRAAFMPESDALSPSESPPKAKKAKKHRPAPRLVQMVESLPPFIKGALMGMALILIGICLGVIAYISYQIWLG